jgi:DNA-binding transcriptional LysR family regulator
MTLHQLRTLLAVAEFGSVRAAADHLYVSQPAVSGAIASLQRELGVDLFERDGRGLRVTPAGHAFIGEARAALDRLDAGIRLARSVEDPARGLVRIVSIATSAERLVLPLLATFRRSFPSADVTVRVGNRAAVWEGIRRGEADLAVAGRPPAHLPARVLGKAANTLVVVGAPPASQDRRAATRVVRDGTWLLREEGSGTRDAADELLAQLGAEPPRMILGSNGAVLEAIAAGFGIGLLPVSAIVERERIGDVVRLPCPGTPIERPWHLVTSARHRLTPTAALAAQAMLQADGGFSPTAEGRRLFR